MTEKTIRWGIVSTAKIGLDKVIPGIQRSKTGTAYAIASRDLDRAKEAARGLGIEKAYGSYEELLADPEIDAIYNPLPNHMHVPVTIQAVNAGKHVLCEKPVALDAEEAKQLLDLPKDKLVAEGFMVRAHPQWIKARDIVRSGDLGELKAIQTFFSYYNDDPGNIRNKADIGGGPARHWLLHDAGRPVFLRCRAAAGRFADRPGSCLRHRPHDQCPARLRQ